jgi:hypothetical protein
VTTIEKSDERLPGEVGDPVREAIGNLLVAIVENTAPGSPERKAAMNEVLESAERVRRAIMPLPKLH